MAISPQRIIRSTSCLVLGYSFRGRWVEWTAAAIFNSEFNSAINEENQTKQNLDDRCRTWKTSHGHSSRGPWRHTQHLARYISAGSNSHEYVGTDYACRSSQNSDTEAPIPEVTKYQQINIKVLYYSITVLQYITVLNFTDIVRNIWH